VRHVVKRCTDVLERMIKGAMAKEAEGTRFRKNRRARQREGKGRREGGTRGFVGRKRAQELGNASSRVALELSDY
jgi:hypothetical protein